MDQCIVTTGVSLIILRTAFANELNGPMTRKPKQLQCRMQTLNTNPNIQVQGSYTKFLRYMHREGQCFSRSVGPCPVRWSGTNFSHSHEPWILGTLYAYYRPQPRRLSLGPYIRRIHPISMVYIIHIYIHVYTSTYIQEMYFYALLLQMPWPSSILTLGMVLDHQSSVMSIVMARKPVCWTALT